MFSIGLSRAAKKALRLVRREAVQLYHDLKSENFQECDLTSLELIRGYSPELQLEIFEEAVRLDQEARWDSYFGKNGAKGRAIQMLVSELSAAGLPYSNASFNRILRHIQSRSSILSLPLGRLIGAIETHRKSQPLSGELKNRLRAVIPVLKSSQFRGRQALIRRMRLLAVTPDDSDWPPTKPRFGEIEADAWAKVVLPWLRAQDEDAQMRWNAVIEHAAAARNRSRPSKRWLTKAGKLVNALGGDVFCDRLEEWIRPIESSLKTASYVEKILNLDLVKCLIWMTATVEHDALASTVGNLAVRFYRKRKWVGSLSVKLGNAAVHALAAMPEERGAAELFGLRGRVQYSSVRHLIEESLGRIVEETGRSIDDIEESVAPSHGLDAAGRCNEPIGDFTAEIALEASGRVSVHWRGEDGRLRKTVPVAIRRGGDGLKAKLKNIRATSKEIGQALGSQKSRLERLFLLQRQWSLEEWRRRYLDHPIVGNLSRRLIWTFCSNGQCRTGMPSENRFADASGQTIAAAGGQTTVAIWHPLAASVDEVKSWRDQLESLQITQPFKQAHRENYLLTEAERATDPYSNRFAGQILRQHSFRSLCQRRNWNYDLQGSWDSHNIPTRPIPEFGLQAHFGVDPWDIDQDDAYFGFDFVVTNQIYFSRAETSWEEDSRVPLDEVPPLLFSEIMREIDLFVSVSSVGFNPNWEDEEERRYFADFQVEFGLGNLVGSAIERREFLQNILPSLDIVDRCHIDDRFLHVKGDLRRYKIHLGSGAVQTAGFNRAICIVPARRRVRENAPFLLPFDGDSTLSVILSKAFLLSKDSEIQGEIIRKQID